MLVSIIEILDNYGMGLGTIFCMLANGRSTFNSARNEKAQLLGNNFSTKVSELGIRQ